MRKAIKNLLAPALLLVSSAVLTIGFQNCSQPLSADGTSSESSLGVLATPTPSKLPTATPTPGATPTPTPTPTPTATPVAVNITTSTNNVNLFALAGSPTQAVTVTVAIAAGVRIGSTSAAQPALTTGTFPAGSEIVLANAGDILGAGGSGGPSGTAGGSGGPAMTLNTPIIINNTGHIYGGGGGGGGGVPFLLPGGTGGNGCGSNFGTATAATSGESHSGYVYGYNGSGGNGGCWGQPGSDGAGAGGAAGPAIITNGVSLRWSGGNTAPALIGAIQ